MRSIDELQRGIDQFDFRLVRNTKVVKKPDGGLTVTHTPPDVARQRREAVRFRTFAERNWTVREIEFASGLHPTGTFHPHEDADALVTRTKIDGTVDGCLVERRKPAEVNYYGFGFSTWEEARAFDNALHRLRNDARMLLGACAALGLHGADFSHGIVKNLDVDENSAFSATVVQLRHEVAEAVKERLP